MTRMAGSGTVVSITRAGFDAALLQNPAVSRDFFSKRNHGVFLTEHCCAHCQLAHETKDCD